VSKCVFWRVDAQKRDLLLAEARSLPIFDFTAALCPGSACAPIIDDRIVLRDEGHLTTTMAKYLATELGAALAQVIAGLPR
jgi:hypothetical protein